MILRKGKSWISVLYMKYWIYDNHHPLYQHDNIHQFHSHDLCQFFWASQSSTIYLLLGIMIVIFWIHKKHAIVFITNELWGVVSFKYLWKLSLLRQSQTVFFPADTWRTNNVIITSKNVVDVIMMLSLRHGPTGLDITLGNRDRMKWSRKHPLSCPRAVRLLIKWKNLIRDCQLVWVLPATDISGLGIET